MTDEKSKLSSIVKRINKDNAAQALLKCIQ